MNPSWKVEIDNDTGPDDEGYVEWYIVVHQSTGVYFDCNSKAQADWLCDILNKSHDLPPLEGADE